VDDEGWSGRDKLLLDRADPHDFNNFNGEVVVLQQGLPFQYREASTDPVEYIDLSVSNFGESGALSNCELRWQVFNSSASPVVVLAQGQMSAPHVPAGEPFALGRLSLGQLVRNMAGVPTRLNLTAALICEDTRWLNY
jgi:hypothetical protein